jgi:dTDP-4-amino-4,6-dideoxy-D-glucose acyltransferase
LSSDFLDAAELAALGLAACGRSVLVSRHAIFFRPERISLGDHTRIDAFCILSAGSNGLRIGRNVHISAYTAVV